MRNNQVIRNDKQPNLLIPGEILSQTDLTLNQKLILGLDFALHRKLGYNSYLNTEIAEMLGINFSYVSLCRNQLVDKNLLIKSGRSYSLTENALKLQEQSRFNYTVLQDLLFQDLSTGAKLLWSVYDSLSQGYREYFAKRETTAKKLGISVEAISKWNRELNNAGLFTEFQHKSRYGVKQTIIITCSFKSNKTPVFIYNRKKDNKGNWIPCATPLK